MAYEDIISAAVVDMPLQDNAATSVVVNNAGADGTLQGGETTGGVSLADGPTDWLPRSMRLLVSDYIDTGYTASLGDFTAAIWFRDFENSPRAYERIIDKDFTAGFWLGRNNSAAEFGGGIREGSSPFGHFTPVVVGQWHHIALQREETIKRLWLDGVVAYEGFIPSTATSASMLRVGLNSGGNSELDFAGLVLSLSGAADVVPALYAGPSQSSAKKRRLLQQMVR